MRRSATRDRRPKDFRGHLPAPIRRFRGRTLLRGSWIVAALLVAGGLTATAAPSEVSGAPALSPEDDPIVGTWRLFDAEVEVSPDGGGFSATVVKPFPCTWTVGFRTFTVSHQDGPTYVGEHAWWEFDGGGCEFVGYGPTTIVLGNGGASASVCSEFPSRGWSECYTLSRDLSCPIPGLPRSAARSGTIGPGDEREAAQRSAGGDEGCPPEIELTGLEVTQGIQNPANAVPLIGGWRPTFVRAHVKSKEEDEPGVKATLKGTTPGGGQLGVVKPLNGAITVRTNPRREFVNHSFLFRLPPSWPLVNPAVDLKLELEGEDYDLVCKDPGSDCTETATFGDEVDVHVLLFGLPTKAGQKGKGTGGPGPAIGRHAVWEMESVLPVSRVRYEWGGTLDWDTDWNIRAPSVDNLVKKMRRMRFWGKWGTCGNGLHKECYYGLLFSRVLGSLGAAGVPDNVFVARHRPTIRDFTVSHEVGHAAGRPHTACSGAEGNPDPTYPYPNGRIDDPAKGNDAHMGLDIGQYVTRGQHSVFDTSYRDLMSYCSSLWISDWTYNRLYAAFKSRFGSTPVGSAAVMSEETLSDPVHGFAVLGSVTPGGAAGTIDSLYQVEREPSPGGVGDFTLTLLGAGGVEIASHVIETAFDPHGGDGSFEVVVPHDPDATQIVLMHGDQVLDTRSASPNPPAVSFTSPAAGSSIQPGAEASWTGSDPDGDDLSFTLLFSPDGGEGWIPLAVDTTETTFVLDPTVMPGTQQGRLRVFASDGFHTAEATSEAFTVPPGTPTVDILAPDDFSIVTDDSMVAFEGGAYDKDDGVLQGDALQWSSDVDGPLGSGNTLLIDVSQLTSGPHRITLTAIDGDVGTGEAVVRVGVVADGGDVPVFRHRRGASLNVRRQGRKLVFRGRVSARTGFAPCAERAPVRLQRKRKGGFVALRKGRTNAGRAFKFSVPRRAGRYRVLAPAIRRGNHDQSLCLRATSKRVRR